MGRICKNTEPPPFHSVSISVEPSYQLRTYLPATLSRYQTFLFSLSLSLSLFTYECLHSFIAQSTMYISLFFTLPVIPLNMNGTESKVDSSL